MDSESIGPETHFSPPQSTISLAEILKDSPHIRVLDESEDGEILRFFDHAGMQGGAFRLLMQRKPRFHDLFEHRGGVSRIAGMRDSDNHLVGTGAFTATPCYINGRPGKFVYLADLRVQTRDHALRQEWKEWFGKVMHQARRVNELAGNSYMACAIIDTNAKARHVLESKSYHGQRMTRLASYSMVNLLSRWPRIPSRATAYQIERGATLEEMEIFLESVHSRQAFGHMFSTPHYELRRRLNAWKGLSLNDFFVARNAQGKIVATTALWKPQCKQTVIEGPRWTNIYNSIARKAGWPEFGQPLEILYMTHLTFSRDLSPAQKRIAFGQLVDAIWPEKRIRRAHSIAFCDFHASPLTPGLRGYLKANVKVGLYLLLPESEVAHFDPATLGEFPPAFEMALV